ncbi:TIGR04255 family protein [Spirulina sp. 06S082]|uniref:TIGR04255 family protein n=1 Tax=Spirulina sp. 06S082 TaxID=3110248 RepID=UPI002B1EAF39|nr:TIGR04255 family protein [Spirulina sp. 06S082]MEA5469935.1 TIGR04255 family protein [Spirulina sp. 06S082]
MQDINSHNTMKVKFKNPPLKEVVFSVNFETLKFSSVHFGKYWEMIKNEFPILPEDKIPTSREEDILLSLPPLRRVVFGSEDEQSLIQLQKNNFAFNFRYKQDCEYPHFPKLLDEFSRHWKSFSDWWKLESGEQIAPPLHCKLTYLNIIDREFGWQESKDNQKIFTVFQKNWQNYPQYPELLNCETRFTLPDGLGYVDVDIQKGQIETDELNKIDAMLFSLTAMSQDKPNNLVKWYNQTHDHILQIFSSLIREEIQESWGKSYEH